MCGKYQINIQPGVINDYRANNEKGMASWQNMAITKTIMKISSKMQ